jgi:hypothetical protein
MPSAIETRRYAAPTARGSPGSAAHVPPGTPKPGPISHSVANWRLAQRALLFPLWQNAFSASAATTIMNLGRQGSDAHDPVDSLTEQVGVPVVPGVLVNKVQHHQPQRHVLAPASVETGHVQGGSLFLYLA